jgi:hypothetical protein
MNLRAWFAGTPDSSTPETTLQNTAQNKRQNNTP